MTREEKLGDFVQWCQKHVTGDEKGEAQIFLDRLFQAFGHGGVKEAGATLEMRVPKNDRAGTAFADLVWKPVVLVEMKKRGEDLQKHFIQAKDYWWNLYPNRPRYVVLCNFDEFRIYDFETQPDTPKDTVATNELTQRWGPLAFLFGAQHQPVFGNDHVAVTREAAGKLAQLYKRLVKRGIEPALAQRFTLQMLVTLFAEDIDLLPKYFLTQLLEDCGSPAEAYDRLSGLFTAMNTPGGVKGGRFKDVRYFNGGLFAQPAPVELNDTEIVALREIAKDDWSKVQPEIFGTLFEQSAGDERRAFGQHFTSPADIMKIVRPTIIEPWRDQIESAKTLKRLSELRDRLHHYRVLDPACGSGNFLYIAYRELKRLEARIVERIHTEFPSRAEPDQRQLSFLSAQNFFGLDINPLAVELAKVTMMIGRKLAIEELHISERDLPLDNLDQNFIVCDALFTDWPKADVIIGNPPFVGAKLLKPWRGPDYVNAVRKAYPDVPGMADYCVYWLRKAHDHLPACTATNPVAGRAGLVGTQNIRNNQSRVGGLDYIVKTGTIVEAVDNQPWSGEANVHCSIANWIKTQDASLGVLPKTRRLWFNVKSAPAAKKPRKRGTGPAGKEYELDCRECAFINSALSDEADMSQMQVLDCNKQPKRCFQGKIPGYAGFMLTAVQRAKLLSDSAEVISPYLTGRELLDEFEITRWVVDFGKRDMLAASAFKSAFDHCKANVLPEVQVTVERERKAKSDMLAAREEHLQRWWQLWNRRDELSSVLAHSHRYIGCSRVTRRPIMVFLSPEICPSDLVQVFAFDDDYSFGILQSRLHFELFRKSSRLKIETDTRYSVREVFEKFPWPQAPTAKQIEAVAEAGREVRRIRADALQNIKGGLRALYRTLELPGANPLKDAHAALDAAVLTAYGFDAKKDLLAQLLALNQTVAQRIESGQPVTAPGVPKDYPKPKELVTQDCIEPPESK
jgi:SAM-dependent methyltransferase